MPEPTPIDTPEFRRWLRRVMSDKYAEALEELDRMKAAGQVSQAQYDLHRSKLLAEASQPRKPLVTRIVLFVVIVAVLFVLLRVVMALIR